MRYVNLYNTYLSAEATKNAFEVFYKRLSRRRQTFSDPNDLPKPKPRVNNYSINLITRTSTRGMIIDCNDENNFLRFQFNPTEINSTKKVVYEERSITGFDNTQDIWINGGGKTISFELMLDATQGSNQDYLSNQSNNLTHNPDRGTLIQCEFFEQFLHPRKKEGVLFVRGNYIPNQTQFAYPSEVFFIYGSLFYKAVLTSADVTHLLFNSDLVPLRSKVQIELNIKESANILTDINFDKYQDANKEYLVNSNQDIYYQTQY
jgi:hypothetical protein